MQPPRFRVRTLMAMVVAAALLVWAGLMGARSYDYLKRAERYEREGEGWREITARNRSWSEFGPKCVDYFALLSRKYRRAALRPWLPVEPDPYAPGAEHFAP